MKIKARPKAELNSYDIRTAIAFYCVHVWGWAGQPSVKLSVTGERAVQAIVEGVDMEISSPHPNKAGPGRGVEKLQIISAPVFQSSNSQKQSKTPRPPYKRGRTGMVTVSHIGEHMGYSENYVSIVLNAQPPSKSDKPVPRDKLEAVLRAAGDVGYKLRPQHVARIKDYYGIDALDWISHSLRKRKPSKTKQNSGEVNAPKNKIKRKRTRSGRPTLMGSSLLS